MTLRELINNLEELSQNGKNDNLDVEVWDSYGEHNMLGSNHLCDPIKDVYLDSYISSNDEYDYVLIHV